MSEKSLKNKVVIITGGSGGIGSAIVNKLSNYRASVVSVYNRNHPDEQSDENIIHVKANLTKSEDWDRLLAFTLNKYGKIDVLINCAGFLEPGDFLLRQEDQLRKMIDINFTSVISGIQKTLMIMKKQGFGHIINIGSLGGIVPMPYSSIYSATKFALRGFTFSLAEELKGTGTTISLITPGSVITKMLDYEALGDNSAISFVSKPISPAKVAGAVLRVIHKPRIEFIIPRSQSIPSKLLVFSPKIFSSLYKILHRIGISEKRKYLNRYCSFTLAKGALR
ncbi:MAG: SDR family oxidoreductase [Ignavibacteriaceae bacterium]|jgi:short-subunit dehydrogenase|nr:SDR family oxidoreductase [Ignavibacteriaceae bacterium]